MEKVEVWLSWQNNKERFQLPVTPSEFGVKTSNNNEKVNINAVGMVNLIGNKNLKELSLSSFFPAHDYSFLDSPEIYKPYEYTSMVEAWMKSKLPIRVVITETPINLPMAIENFEYKEDDGSGDVYFNLDLTEYIFLKKTKYGVKKSKRTTKKISNYEYKIRPGDTLYRISKMEYGTSNKWQQIYNHKDNKKKIGSNPNQIKPGIVLTIPREV